MIEKLPFHHLHDRFFAASPGGKFEDGGSLISFRLTIAPPNNVAAFYLMICRKRTVGASDALNFNVINEAGATRNFSTVLHYPEDATTDFQQMVLMVDLSSVKFLRAQIHFFDAKKKKDIYLGDIVFRSGHYFYILPHQRTPASFLDTLKTAVFIGGTPRSGNTWLSRILNSHPDAIVPNVANENWSFGWPDRQELHDFLISQPRPGFFNLIASHPVPAMVTGLQCQSAMSILSALASAAGVLVAGDKSPNNALGITSAMFLDERIRYIHLTRGIEDFCTSLFFHHKNRVRNGDVERHLNLNYEEISYIRDFESGKVPSFCHEGLLTSYMDLWEEHNQAGLEAADLFPDRVLTITYEDMIGDSLGAITRILSFLNLACDDMMARHINDMNSFARFAGGRKPGQVDNKNFYRRGEIGSYKDFLAPEAIAFIQSHVKARGLDRLYRPLFPQKKP